MTTTDDVARAITVLAHPDTWISVDGGEDMVGCPPPLRAVREIGGRPRRWHSSDAWAAWVVSSVAESDAPVKDPSPVTAQPHEVPAGC